MMKSLVILSILGAAYCAPQSFSAFDSNSGQYRPDTSGAYQFNKVQNRVPVIYNNIRDLSGQYVHDNSGAYQNDDGQYRPDNSGAYVPDNQGSYQSTNDPYRNTLSTYDPYRNNAGISTVTVRPVKTVPVRPVSNGGVAVNANNGRYAIIRQVHDNLQDGYHYVYETENKIYGEEEGHLENVGTDQQGINVKGRYSYTGPDNVVYTVEYIADAEHGFVASGAHLPTVANGPSA